MRSIPPATARARQLRRTMTSPELRLWSYLRARPSGFKFRRQHPIDPYKLDFYCREAGIAIEVDGIAHEMGDNPARDERRDAFLRARGIKTIRIPALELLHHVDGAVQMIVEECLARSPKK